MLYFIPSAEDSLTYELAFENSSSGSFSSVDYAASLLAESVQEITPQWIISNNLLEGSIIRIRSRCKVDIETGTSISSSLLSNLSNNGQRLPTVERVLFVSRAGHTGILGYGCCVRSDAIHTLSDLSSNMSGEILAIGGESFACKESSKLSGWIIPSVEIRSGIVSNVNVEEVNLGGSEWPLATLAVNIIIPSINDTLGILQHQLSAIKNILNDILWEFRYSKTSLCQVPPLTGAMKDTGMSESEYLNAVESATAQMTEGSLVKVVYALRKTGIAQCTINPAALLLAVADGNRSDEGKRYTFLFAPWGLNEEVFICLSPESLCYVDGIHISTDALAGTFASRHIESSVACTDDKTIREHGTVSDFIVAKLSTLGECIVKQKELLQMKDVAHFRQVISTRSLREGIFGLSLILWATQNLHPTPAVCGMPVKAAMASIAITEKFDRGLYSSYCGILGRKSGELLVGLRSAVIHRKTVHVFAGAGLVQGSVPVAEWKEIELKMSQYIRVLAANRRPAMGLEFPNATSAVAAIVIEEMLRQGVGAFCVCPGARSTPFAVAIYRNSVAKAMTQVVHDERAAGFFSLGCSRAGVLCVVLVTSGTAVSNLLPAVSEARESSLPIVLLTADRPSESREVGEAQTIKQVGIFLNLVEFERDFAPPCSESPKLSAYLLGSILSDIAFGIGEIAVRRGQRVHLNFQFRKSELDPIVVEKGFTEEFVERLHPKVTRWLSTVQPYTRHHSIESFSHASDGVVSRMQKWFQSEWRCWSAIMIVGELHSVRDATDLRWMCETLRIPCICDTMSMMTPCTNESNCVFMGVDQLLNSPLFCDALTATVRIVFRIGGSMISVRTLNWMSQLPLATVVRVREDAFECSRHDSTWIADHYVHSSVAEFAKKMTKSFMSAIPRAPRKGIDDICGAFKIMRLADDVQRRNSNSLLHEVGAKFTEPQIAMVIQSEGDGYCPIFLSSSMACRDFDNFTGVPNVRSKRPVNADTRRVGCNRGANGIDGVISSAVGYAYGCSSDKTPVTVLIGDVATLHDVSAIAIAAGVSPGSIGNLSVIGGGRVGKIICVNNSGGAIFSFLPAADNRNDFFSPFLDTPHNLDISLIASALSGSSPTLKCVRVTSTIELRSALNDDSVFFIECFGLPSHVENVALHKSLSNQLVTTLEEEMTSFVRRQIDWTLHKTREGRCESETTPMVVLLHGWMGSQVDWADLINCLHGSAGSMENSDGADTAGEFQTNFDILAVASGGDILCPSLFCKGLRAIIREDLKIFRKLLIVGYSQGGRLGMQFKNLFPSDVHAVLTMGACPGKILSRELEDNALSMLESSKTNALCVIESPEYVFLHSWYSLPIFSDIEKRSPAAFKELIDRRLKSEIPIDLSLRNMICTNATADATIDLLIVGSLDSKYLQLGQQAVKKGFCRELNAIPLCGHIIPLEATVKTMKSAISSLLPAIMIPGSQLTIKGVISRVVVIPFEIVMKTPLVVLTNGKKNVFPTRRGYRIHLIVIAESDCERRSAIGVGEAYEPVFTVPDRRFSGGGDIEVTYESMARDIQVVSSLLQGRVFEIINSPDSVADLLSHLYPQNCVAPAAYGFEQCILHAFAQLIGVSLTDCVGSFLRRARTQRSSHVRINGFASVRDGSDVSSTGPQRQVLKMKVGDVDGECWQSDAVKVNELVAATHKHPHWLRLDANQSWTVSQATQFAALLTDDAINAIEYIEEPLKFPVLLGGGQTVGHMRGAAYQELMAGSSAWQRISIALDETLVELDSAEARTVLLGASLMSSDLISRRSRIVVKPSLLSLSCIYFSDPEEEVTISCTFESGLGLAFQVLIAAFYGEGSHGLHAKGDMIEVDDSTLDFSLLLEVGDLGSYLRVSQAEDLLNRHVAEYRKEYEIE